MSEWESVPGWFWVLAALLAAAHPRHDAPTDRPFRDSPRHGPVPADRPTAGALRPGWPPGEPPPRPPGAGRSRFTLAA